MIKTDLQLIGEDSKDIWARFWAVIEPFRHQLWHYCLKLTGSPWDAEDLLQDTLLKSFAALSALSHREQPLKTKSYIFRIATNHWLDQCRRQKVLLDETVDDKIIETDAIDHLEINEALESLIHHLPPKQAVVFILIESFCFTAKEVAELIVTTEGAVHAILYRARKKLKELNKKKFSQQDLKSPIHLNKLAIKEFIERYNNQDFKGLAELLIDESTFSFVSMTSTEYGKETITKYSLNPNKANSFTNIFAHCYSLWGLPAIVFIEKTEEGERLYDLNTIEWENGKITRWKCYYFCRELMAYAAKELNLSLAPIENF
ncbi:RNA polymerase sigma factor [Heyndrickxia oleronia]|uniref:RNA polymerase sigma factor n=1 Tax=Heyndrickxia oleronia TaxID=38875 RepID=UPI00203BDB9F|nr:RNA polymerase sigma factor [Heyndrickxia oleronia]MCM3238230.1 RNA polymerase sigma factor [Heyndrickxia oleronia]